MMKAKRYLRRKFEKYDNKNETFSNNRFNQIRRCKLALLLLGIEFSFIIIFVAFVEYSPLADASDKHNSVIPVLGGFTQDSEELYRHYNLFQDVHIMLFIGFGYLMAFLRKYGYSAVGFNFLVTAITVQWAILCLGFLNLDEDSKIKVDITSIYEAEIASAAVLISMGAILGRASYIQLIVMGIFEVAVYSGNLYFGQYVLQVADVGGSIFVHTFGAYFGLAVSFCLNGNNEELPLPSLQYFSDLFALIGTIFLWTFWPSFNAIGLTGDDQHRAVINTYYSLTASCVVAFAISAMITSDHKFDMVHVQNSTLAGGVAIGASANLMLQPYGALAVGMVAGLLSTYGYNVLSPWIEKKLKIRDTCGVHNLHGLPGVLAGFVSMLMAGIATKNEYNESLYQIFPARAEAAEKFGFDLEIKYMNSREARSAGMQAVFQGVAILTTVLFAVLSGLITGKLLVVDSAFVVTQPNMDDEFWKLPVQIPENSKNEAKEEPVFVFKPYLRSST